MIRLVLDNCALDKLIEPPARLEAIRAAVADGRLELLETHILREEAERAPAVKRHHLLQLINLGRPTPTGAFVLDVSRFDQGRIAGEEEVAAMEELRSAGGNHTNDALQAMTARHEGAVLVTAETKRLPNRAKAVGVEVWSPEELLAKIGYID